MALLMPFGANAAGLGRLTLLSHLGQPLIAEIELTSVQKGETITARLASQEAYQSANVQFNAALAGTRVTVEKRPNGQVFLKATSPRAVSEPFLELLVEINSEHGRVTRQYTALLDPPGYGSAAGELPPPLASAPTTRRPAAPDSTSSSSAAAAAAPGAPVPQGSGAKQYGPIKRGETLGRIARTVKPEGVSLEQALVGLYRQNPDAFIKKNMNLVRTGKILRVPEANELTAVPHRAAQQEVRLQVADFNAYSARLADRAGAAPEGGSVASGRIGTRTAAASEGSRDTVRLSRGEQAGKGKGKAGTRERVRALEEEAIAREKALVEANERIAQLEKTIKDMQRLAELKSSGTAVATSADKGAKAPAASVAVAPPAASVAVAPPAVPPPKAEPSAAKGAAQDATQPPAPDAAKAAVPEPAVDAAKAPLPPAPKAEPAKVAKKPPPAPAPQMDFVDMLFSEPLYLAAGGAVLLLGGLGFVAARRRRSGGRELQSDDGMVKIAPKLGGGPSGGGSNAAALAIPASRLDERPAAAPARPAGASEGGDNDLDFNVATRRGAAQSQPRSASPAAPTAAPEPQAPPPRAAEPPRVVEPPRAPEPPRVAEPPPRAAVEPPRALEPSPRIVEPPRAAAPPRASDTSRATDVLRAAQAKAAEPLMPDFGLDTPAPTPAAPKPAADTNTIDFNLDPLPPVGTPLDTVNRVSTEPPAPVDFKLDLNSLDIEPAAKRSSGLPARDDHWYDVQQKFDLAKAYEEMGDKEGARDILQEVLKEGDVEQQDQAKKLLGSLS